MKLIIAGSRTISCVAILDHLSRKWDLSKIDEVVSGKARGADRSGELWAAKNGIAVKAEPADWNRYKKAAGPIRNRDMGKYADAALILWDGVSHGSRHMHKTMVEFKKPVHVEKIEVHVMEDAIYYKMRDGSVFRQDHE